MGRKRPETTFYPGDPLYRALLEYRRTLPGPPSASSLVREAVREFLEKVSEPRRLAPADWVTGTQSLMRQLEEHGVVLNDDQILDALADSRDDRVGALLEGGC